MPVPEQSYGLIPGTYDQYGLIPRPAHLEPRDDPSDIQLTKKGEAYCAEQEVLRDINIRELFGESDKVMLPALAEAGGVFFLTLAKGDRSSIATTIQRLIDMLDAMETDPDTEDGADAEPSLGWPMGHGVAQLDKALRHDDDREMDDCDEEEGGDTEFNLGWERGSGSYDQSNIAMFFADECEEENEHGGDIQDEPHDELDEGDREPFLGWGEQCSQGPKIYGALVHDPAVQSLESHDDDLGEGGLGWTGLGCHEANDMLRGRGLRTVRVTPGHGL